MKKDKSFICKPHRHVWERWEQGGCLTSNGTIPGQECACGEMILIERFCSECLNRDVIAVKANSKEAKAYMDGEE